MKAYPKTKSGKAKVEKVEREGKELPKAAHTRATTITKRAEEWKAFMGTSAEVYDYLRNLNL